MLLPKQLSSTAGRALNEADTMQALGDEVHSLAAAIHCSMLAAGFLRYATAGDIKEDEARTEPIPTLACTADWKKELTFYYRYRSTPMAVTLMCSRIGTGKLGVHLQVEGNEKLQGFSVEIRTYVNTSGTTLEERFINQDRLEAFAHLIEQHCIKPVLPSRRPSDLTARLQQEKQEMQDHKKAAASEEKEPIPTTLAPQLQRESITQQSQLPTAPHPDLHPPGFDDEYEVLRDPRYHPPGGGFGFPNIGADDLSPPGLHGMPGPFFDGRDFFGPGGMPGGFSGMHPVMPPHFRPPPGPHRHGRSGGRGNSPYGARYDPTGPGDLGGLGGRNGFSSGGFGGFGGPAGGFGGGII